MSEKILGSAIGGEAEDVGVSNLFTPMIYAVKFFASTKETKGLNKQRSAHSISFSIFVTTLVIRLSMVNKQQFTFN